MTLSEEEKTIYNTRTCRRYRSNHPDKVRAMQKEYRRKNRSRINEKMREYRSDNQLADKHIQLKNRLKRRYRLSIEQYEELLELQGGVCAICRKPEVVERTRLSVDHDHSCCQGDTSCGKCIRGLLCFKCNSLLGCVNDNSTILRNAIFYLEQLYRRENC